MKKSLLALAVLACASSAFAQQAASSSVANHGEINNRVATFAQTTGTGSSYSAATNMQSAASSGFATTAFSAQGTTRVGAVSIGGNSSTSGSGSALNMSSNHGTGSASSVGWADSDVVANANYNGPGQWVSLSGSSDSGMQNRGLNGTDISVLAGRNQGGFAEAATSGDFRAQGAVGSVITGNSALSIKSVFGAVSDIKNSTSQVNTGAMIVNGTQLNTAPTNAQAGTVVNVRGGYGDPV